MLFLIYVLFVLYMWNKWVNVGIKWKYLWKIAILLKISLNNYTYFHFDKTLYFLNRYNSINTSIMAHYTTIFFLHFTWLEYARRKKKMHFLENEHVKTNIKQHKLFKYNFWNYKLYYLTTYGSIFSHLLYLIWTKIG